MSLDDLVPAQFRAPPEPDPLVGLNKAERFLAEFVEDKPTLQKILTTVGRPGAAVSNLLEAGVLGVQGRGGEALDRLKSAGGQVVDFGGDILEGVAQIPDAVIPGDAIPSNIIPNVTGPEDFRSFTNVLQTAGVGKLGTVDAPLIGEVSGRGFLGLLGDIVTDPLNIAAGPILRATSRPVAGVSKFLRTKTPLRHLSTGSPQARRAATGALIEGGEVQARLQGQLDDVWSRAQKAAADEGLAPDVAIDRFTEAIQHKGDPLDRAAAAANLDAMRQMKRAHPGLTNREAARAAIVAQQTGDDLMAPFAGQAQERLAEILRVEQHAGLPVTALNDPGVNYLTRVLTPEAAKELVARGKWDGAVALTRSWVAKHGSQKARKAIYGGKTIDEVNKFVRDELGTGFKFELFTKDPAAIFANRARKAGRTVRSSSFFRRAIDDFAVPESPAQLQAGARSVDEVLRAHGLTPGAGPFAGSGGKMFPVDVVDDINKVFAAWTNPATPTGVLGHFVRLTDTFKGLVTAPFPAFHFRNMMSNVWANYLGGLRNPIRYTDAIGLVADMRRGGAKVWSQYGGHTTKQIIETMGSGRALGFGSTSAEEFASLAAHPGTKLGRDLLRRPDRAIVKVGRDVGEMVENNAKIAHVLDQLARGKGLDDAIFSAKKHLFDYGELSPIEKRFFRRAVPFWGFMRNNLPLQLESLFTKPGKIANLSHFQDFLQARGEGGEGVDTSIIPPWVRRRLFGFRKKDDGSLDTLSGVGLGFEELSMLDRPFEEMMSMLNPLIKGPLQGAVNKDFFRDIPLAKADIAPSPLRWLENVPGGKTFLNAIDFRPVKERNGETRFYRANPRALNAIFGVLVPGTSRAAQFASQLDPALAERTGAPDTGTRFFTGFRKQSLSPIRQMQENTRRMLEQGIERMKQLQLEGVTFEVDDRFAIRRDIGVDDPRRAEARAIQRQINKFRKALSLLSRTERAAMAREGLRTGGR